MNKETDEEKALKQLAERIALKEFDQEIEPHTFSDAYQKRKMELLKKSQQESSKSPSKRIRSKRLLLIAAAALFIIPTTVYAANELYQWFVQKNDYKVTLSIDPNKTDTSTAADYYKLDLGYLPEDMVPVAHTENKFTYKDNLNKGGFSFQLWKIKSPSDFDVLYSKDYQETTFNQHQAIVVKKAFSADSETDSSTEVLVYFEKEGYVLEAFVGNDVTDDVLEKVLNALSLQACSKEEALYVTDFDDFKKQLAAEEPAETAVVGLPENSSQIHQIGDTIPVTIAANEKEEQQFNFTLKSVDIYDTIKEFPTTNFNPMALENLESNQLIDNKKQLIPFNQKIISYGDGESSINQVKEEYSMTAKFIYLTAVIKNQKDQPITDLYFQNSVLPLENKNGIWMPIHENKEVTALTGELDYLEFHGEGKSYYQLQTLAANEERVIHFGFFADEDQLSKLFLPVFYYDNYNNLNDPSLNFYDIRQQ
ncbi:hypothetical protein BAU15_10910 [Enterococcus sp. JM4C]|uniref:hypothetical protein n=1 Tax=Candidatus Enterococcus huntleyi TaxID=1857217 RepID=UPI00137B66F0|nr:hypothetical protein [Enterococcus sp. JM4C]KAF1298628.1 hypothetical protein BAU15_10910 [Enterococcus sp. JM4C]